MTFLKWLGGIVLLLWIIGLIFKIGGNFINLLLIASSLIFIIDAFSQRKKYK